MIAFDFQLAHNSSTFYQQNLTFYSTSFKRITSVSTTTRANGTMVDDTTDCVLSAGVKARIDAFISLTSLIAGAVRVDHALDATVWRGSVIVDLT